MIDQNSRIEVSIVMPCLNEAETLEICIHKAQKAIKRHAFLAEIIIADNGSTDDSQQIAKKNGARVIPVENKGYGSALLGGISAAKGKFIIMGDADDSYDFEHIHPFVEKLRDGYDLVMGCRLPAGGGKIMKGAMPAKHRYLGNPALSKIGRVLFRSPITDFHCGLRAFTKKAFNKLNLKTTGMEFASEMVLKASILKMKLTEIPITLYKDGRTRPPHLRSWRDGWRHLRFMLMYSPGWLFLLPGISFFIFGAIAFSFLTFGPVHIGKVTFDTNTLLVSAMLILLGAQLIIFYLFTKTFSVTEGLLPGDPFLNRLFKFLNLEIGIFLGVVIFLTGGILLFDSVLGWSKAGYGNLSYPLTLRKVIPAVTMITLGWQIIFSSFFMSLLGLHRN